MARKRGSEEAAKLKRSVDRIQAEKRRRERRILAWGVVGVTVLLVAIVALGLRDTGGGDELVPLAKCITESGAAMFGTDWCPHCQAQKRAFGDAFKYIDYKNCDYDRACTERGVSGYPTWILGDGTRLQGEQGLETLAARTECTTQMP